MKKFRKLSLVLAMSLVLTQMPFTGVVFTYAEPEDESVSQDEAASENSVSDADVEAETEEAATGDPDPEFVMATSWDGIQNAFNDGKSVKLVNNISGGSADAPLMIKGGYDDPSQPWMIIGKNVTLDLNGYKLWRSESAYTLN